MTVKELIEKLKTYNEDEQVRISVHGTLKYYRRSHGLKGHIDMSLEMGSIAIEEVHESMDCDDTDYKQVDLRGDFGEISL